MLEVRIGWFAQWSTEREVAEEASRRRGRFELPLHRPECDRGQSGCLENMGERAHGTGAKRSNGGQQHDIDSGIEQYLRPFGPRVHPNAGDLELVSGVGEVHVSDGADRAVLGEFL